jgi:hypothetical protein
MADSVGLLKVGASILRREKISRGRNVPNLLEHLSTFSFSQFQAVAMPLHAALNVRNLSGTLELLDCRVLIFT